MLPRKPHGTGLANRFAHNLPNFAGELLADRSHDERYDYACYLRRVARKCSAPYVAQEDLEKELLAILRAVRLPEGAEAAIDEEAARLRAPKGKAASPEARAIEKAIKNWDALRAQGEISQAEFEAKAAELHRRRDALRADKTPSVTRQLETIRSLVDHWGAMTVEERKRLIGFVFEDIRAGVDGIKRFLPREDWRRYMAAVVQGCLPERKTGVKHAEVVTARIAQDERGWLRLAG
ncbi:MAG TPA: SHOCT domain-containing protein [Candidatus Limnocylindria bacterium]|nr:SHOCT domain-containing protein [Candidatus Limnocylindria bacterium]